MGCASRRAAVRAVSKESGDREASALKTNEIEITRNGILIASWKELVGHFRS